jgi:hypothetical protein
MSLTPEEIEKLRQQVAETKFSNKASEDTSDKGRERRFQREDVYADDRERFRQSEDDQKNRFKESSLTERLRRFQDDSRRRFEQNERNRFQQEFDFSRGRGR